MCYLRNIKSKLFKMQKVILSEFIKFIKILLKIFSILIPIVLFLLISMLLLRFCEVKNPETFESQEILILGVSLTNWGTWVTLIGLLFTALWSMHQFNKNQLYKQQEKASEIAIKFSDSLIEKMGLISDVLTANKQMDNLIKELDTSKLNQFTLMEMIDIYKDEHKIELFLIL